MYISKENTSAHKSRAVSDSSVQRTSSKQTSVLADNRPEAARTAELQSAITQSASPGPIQLRTEVVQRVSAEEAGEYIGYTLGGAAPTFYFANGHYTSAHDNANNVGWHPNKGDRHFITNINEAAYYLYVSKRGEWQRGAKTKFGQAVERGGLDAEPGEGKMIEGDVFLTEEGEEVIYLHPSRGRLIRVGDPDFDPNYAAEHAIAAVESGGLAANER